MRRRLRCFCLLPFLFLINAKIVTIHTSDGSAKEKYLAYDVRKITFAKSSTGIAQPGGAARKAADNVTLNRNGDGILLSIGEKTFVAIDLYDVRGRRVLTLERETHAAGTSAIAFPRRSLARGIYCINARYNGKVLNKRLAIVR